MCSLYIINFFFPFLVDFVKYFGSGDQKYHQDREIEYSQDNVLNVHLGQEISEPIVGEEKNYTDNAVTSVTFPDDMDIDTKNFNSQSLDQIHTVGRNAVDSCCNADLEGANLSSEVSAIYLAMKNSKLECIDEHGQDSMSVDVYVEDDQYEEFDDFDSYFFIKKLTRLVSSCPNFYLYFARLHALGSSSLLFLVDMSRVSVINSQVDLGSLHGL